MAACTRWRGTNIESPHNSIHVLLGFRKGTNGVSTNGVTANFMFFDRGTFWVFPLTYFYHPQSAMAYLFHNLSIVPQSDKIITFAAAPLLLTQFVLQPTFLFSCEEPLRSLSSAGLGAISLEGAKGVPRNGGRKYQLV